MILVLVLLYTKVGVDATFHTVGQENAGKDEENLQHCTNHYLDKPARLRYLSKSTKITTNIETAMLSTVSVYCYLNYQLSHIS